MLTMVTMVAAAWVSTPEMGTLSITVDAAPYRGRRVRVEGRFGGAVDADWSGVWLRVDGRDAGVTFDNTLERDGDGTAWQVHTVELDVPPGAKQIAFGLLLSGQQTVRVDDLELVDVGRAKGRSARGRARRARRAKRR